MTFLSNWQDEGWRREKARGLTISVSKSLSLCFIWQFELGCLWGSSHCLIKRTSTNGISFSETFRTVFCWVVHRNTWTAKQYICNSKLQLGAYPLLPVPLSPFMSESYFDLRH